MSNPFSRKIARYAAKVSQVYRQLLTSEIPLAIRVVAIFTLGSGLINVVVASAIAVQTIDIIRDILQTPPGNELSGPIGFLLTLISAIVNLVGLLTIFFSIVQILVGLLFATFAFKAGTALLSFKPFGPSITYTSQGLFLLQGFIVRLTGNPHPTTEALTLSQAIHQGLWTYYAVIAPLFTIGLLAFVLIRHPKIRNRFQQATR